MRISDVKVACNCVLQKEFAGDRKLIDPMTEKVRIYGNDSHDGYARPAFFTEILRTAYTLPHRAQRGYKFAFIVTILEATHDESFCLRVLDRITEAFGLLVPCNGQILTVEGIEHSWIDVQHDVMQITVDFAQVMVVKSRYRDDISGVDMMHDVDIDVDIYAPYEYMGTIHQHIEQKG